MPFHVWTPDVYEGAPLPVTAFMSVVTKAGDTGGVRALHLCGACRLESRTLLMPIWIVAALSMIVGNVGTLAQTDMKRLLAYSGIAQVGYIVAALAGTNAARHALCDLLSRRVHVHESRRVRRRAAISRDPEAGVALGTSPGSPTAVRGSPR